MITRFRSALTTGLLFRTTEMLVVMTRCADRLLWLPVATSVTTIECDDTLAAWEHFADRPGNDTLDGGDFTATGRVFAIPALFSVTACRANWA